MKEGGVLILKPFARAALLLTLAGVVGCAAALIVGAALPRWQIAFLSDINIDSNLYLMDVRTGLTRRITGRSNVGGDSIADPASSRDPSWSPDGSRLAFSSYRQNDYDIYSIGWDGTEFTNLTQSSQLYETHPVWSPDGTRIAFIRQDGIAFSIMLMNADASNVRRLAPTVSAAPDPAWSPDGTRIVFLASTNNATSDLFIVDVGLPETESPPETTPEATLELEGAPTLTPDEMRAQVREQRREERLQLQQQREAERAAAALASETDVMRMPDVTRVTLTDPAENYPVWSPDGTRIAYVYGSDGAAELRVLELNSGDIRTIATGLAVRPIAWSEPTGQPEMIAYEYFYRDTSNRVVRVSEQFAVSDLDGNLITQYGTIAQHPGWSPDNSMVAFTFLSGTIDIYVMDVPGGGIRPLVTTALTDSHPIWRP